jgi:proline dehydrogenase
MGPESSIMPCRSLITLLQLLFERGDNFAVATHDSELIEETKRLAESKRANFEFQMLKGMGDELKVELVSSGYKVTEYPPYGTSWLAYSRRRLSERPCNFWLLMRSLV